MGHEIARQSESMPQLSPLAREMFSVIDGLDLDPLSVEMSHPNVGVLLATLNLDAESVKIAQEVKDKRKYRLSTEGKQYAKALANVLIRTYGETRTKREVLAALRELLPLKRSDQERQAFRLLIASIRGNLVWRRDAVFVPEIQIPVKHESKPAASIPVTVVDTPEEDDFDPAFVPRRPVSGKVAIDVVKDESDLEDEAVMIPVTVPNREVQAPVVTPEPETVAPSPEAAFKLEPQDPLVTTLYHECVLLAKNPEVTVLDAAAMLTESYGMYSKRMIVSALHHAARIEQSQYPQAQQAHNLINKLRRHVIFTSSKSWGNEERTHRSVRNRNSILVHDLLKDKPARPTSKEPVFVDEVPTEVAELIQPQSPAENRSNPNRLSRLIPAGLRQRVAMLLALVGTLFSVGGAGAAYQQNVDAAALRNLQDQSSQTTLNVGDINEYLARKGVGFNNLDTHQGSTLNTLAQVRAMAELNRVRVVDDVKTAVAVEVTPGEVSGVGGDSLARASQTRDMLEATVNAETLFDAVTAPAEAMVQSQPESGVGNQSLFEAQTAGGFVKDKSVNINFILQPDNPVTMTGNITVMDKDDIENNGAFRYALMTGKPAEDTRRAIEMLGATAQDAEGFLNPDHLFIARGADVDTYLRDARGGSAGTTLALVNPETGEKTLMIALRTDMFDPANALIANNTLVEENVQRYVWGVLFNTFPEYNVMEDLTNGNMRAFGEWIQHGALKRVNGGWMAPYQLQVGENQPTSNMDTINAQALELINTTLEGSGLHYATVDEIFKDFSNPAKLRQINDTFVEKTGKPVWSQFGLARNGMRTIVPDVPVTLALKG